MNPTLLLAAASFNKRLAVIVAATMIVVVSMPIIGVFSLGSGALSYLAHTLLGSDSTTAVSTTTVGLYEGPGITGDTYAWGNCTYWVYALRLQAGDPIPTTWGNAATWAPRALADGYAVDHTPSVGAIMQTADAAQGLGHVAYVTAVDPITGTWTISEMNVQGLDIVDTAMYSATKAANYNFIHDKEASP